ncbi:MAG: sulfatase [Bryobacterales bacterium]
MAAPVFAQRDKRPNILFAISDDQSFPHTGAAGDPVVRTPHFDRIAAEGVRFPFAYCSSPSCTPSRGAILTGQECYRLREGMNLWSSLPSDIPVYTDLLEQAGYHVGHSRKGWGPGDFSAGGRKRNPAGEQYKTFESFFEARPKNQPFCFWFGSQDPHRPYEKGTGLASGLRIEDVVVPQFLPDEREVRSDILDYFYEIERFDRDIGLILSVLERAGELDNTLVVVTSDNGMPFPRAKTNLYDHGVRLPLAMRWPERIRGGRVVEDFVSFVDFAPTFLELAGVDRPREMTGRSLVPQLDSHDSGRIDSARDHVIVARERHTIRRAGGVGYPMRAIRTHDALYIRNIEPDRWPAGDPPTFGDIDGSPTKDLLLENRETPGIRRYFELACAKRPTEELYDMAYATDQTANVAGQPAYSDLQNRLQQRLDAHLRETLDPRALGQPGTWESAPYYGRGGSRLL